MGNILNVVNNDNNKKPKPDAVLLEEVQMLTDMSESNINRLYEIWISYDTDFDGEMSQEEFLSIPEIAASPLKDRLMLLLNMASTETGSDRVTFNAFAILLSVMSIVCITFNIYYKSHPSKKKIIIIFLTIKYIFFPELHKIGRPT